MSKDVNEGMALRPETHLVSFVSGHYKKIVGTWKGDSVWAHFQSIDGRMIHINKDKVEYIQTMEGE